MFSRSSCSDWRIVGSWKAKNGQEHPINMNTVNGCVEDHIGPKNHIINHIVELDNRSAKVKITEIDMVKRFL
jgi:hypothetical protein